MTASYCYIQRRVFWRRFAARHFGFDSATLTVPTELRRIAAAQTAFAQADSVVIPCRIIPWLELAGLSGCINRRLVELVQVSLFPFVAGCTAPDSIAICEEMKAYFLLTDVGTNGHLKNVSFRHLWVSQIINAKKSRWVKGSTVIDHDMQKIISLNSVATYFSDLARRSDFGNQMCQAIHICDSHMSGMTNHIWSNQTLPSASLA